VVDRAESFHSLEASSSGSVFNGVCLSTSVSPARGGDWCETFVLSQDVVALSIGDVCGHGAAAFPAMVATRQAVRDAAFRGLDPALTLAAVNHFVCDLDPELQATAFFGLLNTRTGVLTFANAGHPAPLIVGPGGSTFLSFPHPDVPLGVLRSRVPALRVAFAPAQTLLVLYTDGVIEHERQALRGETQLRDAAMSAYGRATPPTASSIEQLMSLAATNEDDASILASWTPREE